MSYPKPRNYDPAHWELWLLYVQGWEKHPGRVPKMNVIPVPALKNNKFDVDNRGAVSTDYIGASWTYPDASYEARARIWQDHIDYTAGLFYFLANDPRVPGDYAPMSSRIPTTGLMRSTCAKLAG